MNQKSSVPQVASFVSQALKRDTRFAVPFPGMGNQKRFKAEMVRILPTLPRLSGLSVHG